MKFTVEVPEDRIPGLRYIVAEMMDCLPEEVKDEDMITELFYIYTGYHGSELDLREHVKVHREG